MSNADIKKFADALADILQQIADLKLEASSVIEAADEAGVDTKALRKIARELVTDSDKLARQYEAEEQLELFREETGIRNFKGLDGGGRAAT